MAVNTYPGHPNSPLPGMPTSVSFPATITADVSTLPNADFTTPPPLFTEAPFAPGSREDCARYVDGSDYQFDLTGFGFGSMCQFVAKLSGVGVEELGVWNPGEDILKLAYGAIGRCMVPDREQV